MENEIAIRFVATAAINQNPIVAKVGQRLLLLLKLELLPPNLLLMPLLLTQMLANWSLMQTMMVCAGTGAVFFSPLYDQLNWWIEWNMEQQCY